MRLALPALLCGLLLAAPVASAAGSAGFDIRYTRMERAEAFFLEDLFGLCDEMAAENGRAASWLLSNGEKGTPFARYRERTEALLRELGRLETPARVAELRTLVGQAFRAQRDFLADWASAHDQGRAFDSQLTSEFGFHAGLHEAHRALLRAYERTLGLFPDESRETRRAFQDALGRLDLTRGGRR